MKPFKISGIVKNYTWGRLLDEALVAKLAKATDRNNRYAEFWVGAHPQSPSVCLTPPAGNAAQGVKAGLSLTELLQQAPEEMLGRDCLELFGNQLPFLLKVLSIQQPLSIQLHPDVTLASELHDRDAKNYPDKNHKPEIAIAITPVTLLHSVRDFAGSVRLLERFPRAFKRLVSDGDGDPRLALIKAVLALTPEDNHELIEEAKQVIRGLVEPEEEDLWFLKAERVYPRDRGLWFFFILRLLRLNPGEAIFTGAGCLHAYLYGELIECMASSDNTIRAGLTEKFVDIHSLLRALKLPASQKEGEELIELGGIIRPRSFNIMQALDVIQTRQGKQRQAWAVSYHPPVKDFAVTVLEDAAGKEGAGVEQESCDGDASDAVSSEKFQQRPDATVFNLSRGVTLPKGWQGPLLVLNLHGDVWIDDGEQSGIKLDAGESAFIPAACVGSSHVTITVKSGRAVLAHGNW